MARTPINRYIGSGSSSYTVPTDKHFVGRIHALVGAAFCTINGKQLSVNGGSADSALKGGIVLVSGDVVYNNEVTNTIHLQGFIVDTEPAPVPLNRYIGDGSTSYTIPDGKHFVGRIHGNGGPVTCTINSRAVSVKTNGGLVALDGTVTLVAGDVIANSQETNYIFLQGFLYNNE